jgi:hypothetical protein
VLANETPFFWFFLAVSNSWRERVFSPRSANHCELASAGPQVATSRWFAAGFLSGKSDLSRASDAHLQGGYS